MRSQISGLGLFCLSLLISSLGCRESSKVQNAYPEVITLEYNLAKTDSSWQAMIKSDDFKISNLKRIVQELELIEGTNEARVLELQSKIETLKQSRFDRYSMATSSKIDEYDNFTNSVISDVKKIYSENPNAKKYQILNQLLEEIQLSDDSVLQYRKNYDKTIENYRNYLKKNSRELKKHYSKFDSLSQFSLFRLIP